MIILNNDHMNGNFLKKGLINVKGVPQEPFKPNPEEVKSLAKMGHGASYLISDFVLEKSLVVLTDYVNKTRGLNLRPSEKNPLKFVLEGRNLALKIEIGTLKIKEKE